MRIEQGALFYYRLYPFFLPTTTAPMAVPLTSSRATHKTRLLVSPVFGDLMVFSLYKLPKQVANFAPKRFRQAHDDVNLGFVQVLAFALIGADGVDRNAGCIGKCFLRQAALFPHSFQTALTGGKVRFHDLIVLLNVRLMKRSIKANKLPVCNTTVLVRQGISGSFEVFPLAFPETLLYTDIN